MGELLLSHFYKGVLCQFKNSIRSRKSKSGLDYSKMVIIENSDYLSTQNAVIDTDEYKETRQNIEYTKTKQETIHKWISLLHDYSINLISDR